MLWIVGKAGVSREALPLAFWTNGFLNFRLLQDYGLGAHWWKRHWQTKRDMLEALARHAGVEPAGRPGGLTTAQARALLEADGVDPCRCAVPGCSIVGQPEVQAHHIVRRATRLLRDFDIDDVRNLIPLCRHHHGVADRFRARDFDLTAPTTLRSQLLAKFADAAPRRNVQRHANAMLERPAAGVEYAVQDRDKEAGVLRPI
jgi:hypothetical protein